MSIKARKKILVGKFEMTEGRHIAVFRGGGLQLADDLAKSQYQKYKVKEIEESIDNLAGLSCRWKPVKAKKDKILSLLVISQDENKLEVYQRITNKLNETLKGNIEDANPISSNGLEYQSFFSNLKNEIRYHHGHFNMAFLFRFIEIFLSMLLFKMKLPVATFDVDGYVDSLRQHSDFRKFDDVLRLIIDCKQCEMDTIVQYLEGEYQQGHIFYGHHISDNALMTCYVEDVHQGNHIHFVDGGDGGYAMAAKQLKDQMKKATDLRGEKKISS